MALFKSWFIDYEPFGGQLPTIWKSGVLGDFVEIKRGGSPRPIQNFLSDSGLHWLKISDATCISSPFINEIKEYIIEDGLKKTVFLKAGNLVLSNSATPGYQKFLILILAYTMVGCIFRHPSFQTNTYICISGTFETIWLRLEMVVYLQI